VAARRTRRISRTRRFFVGAIQAQITGTRILAAITFLVLAGGGAAWLAGTTGSPVIGAYFIVLAAVLTVTVYAFLKLMGTFISSQR
jgi:ABC-type Na+ efflux pump permease subunit